jgi:hypothetical protein
VSKFPPMNAWRWMTCIDFSRSTTRASRRVEWIKECSFLIRERCSISVEIFRRAQSEGFEAIERGKFEGRCGFKLGNAIEENAAKLWQILGNQAGAGRLFKVRSAVRRDSICRKNTSSGFVQQTT